MSRNAALNGKFLDSIVGVTVHRAAAGDDNQRTLEILVRPFARACQLDFFTVLVALVAEESDLVFGLELGNRLGADRLRVVYGKSVLVTVDICGLRIIYKQPTNYDNPSAQMYNR